MNFEEVMQRHRQKQQEADQKLKASGGMCIRCEKEKADRTSKLNAYHCKVCNQQSLEVLKKLGGSIHKVHL